MATLSGADRMRKARSEIVDFVQIFDAQVLNVGFDQLMVSSLAQRLASMISRHLLGRYGIIEIQRSGQDRAQRAAKVEPTELTTIGEVRNHGCTGVLRGRTPTVRHIANRKVAILGYGSQGHAHALNLKESGIDVRVGLREGSGSKAKAEAQGLPVKSIAEASAEADLIMILLPDTEQAGVYAADIAPNLNEGDALFFSHGFNIRFDEIVPPANVDVAMVAPKGPGHLVRRTYVEGGGVPCLIAVEQDPTGGARDLALGLRRCNWWFARAGVIETTFTEECETDLFGEQAVLCGGTTALVQAGFETRCEAGYQPEVAYFECLHELKLIVDLMYEQGIGGMRYSISDTAEYGDLTRGPRIVNADVKAEMKKILGEIQDGSFAKEWIAEGRGGRENFHALEAAGAEHQIETVGKELRAMMPWISEGKTSVQDASGGQG